MNENTFPFEQQPKGLEMETQHFIFVDLKKINIDWQDFYQFLKDSLIKAQNMQ